VATSLALFIFIQQVGNSRFLEMNIHVGVIDAFGNLDRGNLRPRLTCPARETV
jgi:hypothetical protein